MTNTYGPQASPQVVFDAYTTFNWGAGILYFPARFASIGIENANTHLTFLQKLLLSSFLMIYTYSLAVASLSYFWSHRVTPPAWLTFGHSISFGDPTPDVCMDAVRLLSPSGEWRCAYEDLGIWVVNVSGPNGWKYFFRPDATLIKCMAFLVWAILAPLFLAKVLRRWRTRAARRRLAAVAPPRCDDKLERKAKDLEIGST